ncbi:MAG: response regulator [candidate division Zixibacteria bacterium]|jgi:DNA-binding response OmpR family regulator|nr:response regulator [candidate division Zixibacteria bacterium]
MARVLVVDDEENILKLYKMELTSEGFDVDLASSGDQALVRLEEGLPDIIVLDVKMDDKDGLETLSQVKQKYSDLPVILNTAYNTYKNNFQSWLAEDYVIKSADLSELKNKIREILKL